MAYTREELLREKERLTCKIVEAATRLREIDTILVMELAINTPPKTQAEFDFRYQNNPLNED